MVSTLVHVNQLQETLLMDATWRKKAACLGSQIDIFYPERGGTSIPARRICCGDDQNEPCPVRQQCLDWACTFPIEEDKYGIFGGMTAPERRAYRKNNNIKPRQPKPQSKPKPLKAPNRKPRKRPDYFKGKRTYLTGLDPNNPRYIPPVKNKLSFAPTSHKRHGYYGEKRIYLTGFEHEGLT